MDKRTILTVILSLIPLSCSVAAAAKFSAPLMIVTVILDFIVIAVNPFTKHRECLFMFPLIVITATPICFSTIRILILWEIITTPIVLKSFLIFCIMISSIEILLEVICRLIWKKQYKLS